MLKRPIAVTILAVLLMITGAFGLAGDCFNFKSLAHDHYEILWIGAVHVLAIVAGIFLLRGHNWARWLAVAWMAFHVAISIYHPLQQLMLHAAFLLLFAWFLFFTADARGYFRGRAQAG